MVVVWFWGLQSNHENECKIGHTETDLSCNVIITIRKRRSKFLTFFILWYWKRFTLFLKHTFFPNRESLNVFRASTRPRLAASAVSDNMSTATHVARMHNTNPVIFIFTVFSINRQTQSYVLGMIQWLTIYNYKCTKSGSCNNICTQYIEYNIWQLYIPNNI